MSMTPSRRTIESMTLEGMAADNRSIAVRCYSCRVTRVFLTVDLVRVYGGQQSPHELFGSCSNCGGRLRRNFGFPHRGDTVRRPELVTGWKWRDTVYDPDEFTPPN